MMKRPHSSRFRFSLILLLAGISVSCSPAKRDATYQAMTESLVGRWQASAWGGTLEETWRLGNDRWLHQQAVYFEGSDTSYRAQSKIEQVGEDLILFTVIRNSNPKIFKAVSVHPDSVVFENTEYQNPFRVIYVFPSGTGFRRTIVGRAEDTLTSTTFNFQRQNP